MVLTQQPAECDTAPALYSKYSPEAVHRLTYDWARAF